MFKSRPKLGYIVNLVVTVVCIMILPMYILKSHPFYGFILGLILATIINSLLGAKWMPERKLFNQKSSD
ncbi:hypothetical protein ABE61_18515 [Lysinibacillus sphaericus]|uniref:hypothetical protein n=1 Tax=Lysinibacillus sphaericus TaxID=1421 RepID=UPI0019D5A922|nr:hypothetical protein [Lysinibacillus sphaericus]MBG9455978.1 hypothetical protein [Lysinibacillus sphaericus]MBG9479623.1 hypothetical protein [Lysinibacillus sphaericus]MBG9593895.1 hypothetical protein [Lysinibacillus sphaericus]